MSQKKSEYFTMRADPELKRAVAIYGERNFIPETNVIRMAIAQFPPIKKILEELRAEDGD